MRVIVEIPWGPHRGRRAILEPGKVLKVGRDSADFELPLDPQISMFHFELEWDGARCSVRDRKSATGTLLNGAPVAEGEVKNGDWIRAGDTIISVYFEGATPRKPRPRMPGRFGNSITRSRKASVLSLLSSEADPLFAVVDPTRSDRVLELLHESVDDHRSLYEGAPGDALADFAPYLVEFEKDSKLLVSLVKEGWQRRWGIFLTSRRPFKEVRRHFRRFLMVKDEDTNEQLYFRFYDPVPLRMFLPTCSERQLDAFYGDIGAFLVEGDRGEVLRFKRGQLEAETLD